MVKSKTDNLWGVIDATLNEAIFDIRNYVSTLPGKKMEYRGIVEHDLPANYVYIDDNDRLIVNYNYEEEMEVMHLAVHEILNLHDEIPNEM